MARSNIITKRTIEAVKSQVNIVDLARDYFDLKNHGHYMTINGNNSYNDFSSVVIYPATNTFFRNSNREGGDVIKFVLETKIEGIDNFTDAVKFLKGRIDPEFKIELQKKTIQKKYGDLDLQEKVEKMKQCHEKLSESLVKDDNNKNIIAYMLNERKIDKSILYHELDKGRVCQCITPNGNKAVAYVSYDRGLMSAVSIRGINRNSTFKGDLKGCNYDIGWRIFPEVNNQKVIYEDSKIFAFEGYVDMLSYMSLAKQENKDISRDIFVCCGSVNKYKCVVNLVEERKLKNEVVVCFDNDEKGQLLGDKLIDEITNLGFDNITSKDISQLKDWNEDLKSKSDVTNKTLADRKAECQTRANEQVKIKNTTDIKIER